MQSKTKYTLYELLTSIFPKIDLIEEKQFKKHNLPLTINEVRIIVEIGKHENKTVSEIAKKLCISTSTLSLTVDRLEDKGYVIRNQNENDRRIVHLSVTKDGKKAIDVYQSIVFDMINNLVADLRVGESSILIRALENVNEYFKKQIEE